MIELASLQVSGMGWFVSGSIINIVVDSGQICSSIIQPIVPGPSKVVGQLEMTGDNLLRVRRRSRVTFLYQVSMLVNRAMGAK